MSAVFYHFFAPKAGNDTVFGVLFLITVHCRIPRTNDDQCGLFKILLYCTYRNRVYKQLKITTCVYDCGHSLYWRGVGGFL